MQARFNLIQVRADDSIDPEEIAIESSSLLSVWGKVIDKMNYEILIKNNRICELKVNTKDHRITARCTDA